MKTFNANCDDDDTMPGQATANELRTCKGAAVFSFDRNRIIR